MVLLESDRCQNFDSCGERFIFSLGNLGELESCRRIAEEFPQECGACHPHNCSHAEQTPSPTPNNFSRTTPSPTPPRLSFNVTDPNATHCGCFACNEEVLDNVVFGYSCRERIDFLQTLPGGGYSEMEACYITSEAFPDNGCGPAWCVNRL